MSRTRENLLRGVQIAWQADRRGFIGTAIIAMVTVLMTPIVIWLGKHLVDQLVHGVAFAATWPTVAALGVLAGAERALGVYRNHQQDLWARRVEHHAMRRFLARTSSVDIAHFDDAEWHDRMQRARRDVPWRPLQLAVSVIGLGTSIVGVLGLLGLLATLHPLLVVLALASVVPWVVIQRRINRKIYEFHFSITKRDRERWYYADLLSGSWMAKELRSFGLATHVLDRYQRIADDDYEELARLYKSSNVVAVIAGLASGAMLAGAYAFLSARSLAGSLTPGDLTAAIGGVAALIGQASAVSSSLLNLDQHSTFLDDFFGFLSGEALVPVADAPRPVPETLAGGIVARDVHFTYPRGTKAVLRGIDLEIRPGELIALVGENGSGKTTIVNLLTRFYDPTAGSITIGGVDARDLDPAELRGRIGVLFQDFAKLQLTLRDNVQLGRVERAAGDEEIRASLDAAHASYLVTKLDQGLDARLGRAFEGGHELSGGEWQRLALARLIHRRADLWILDEPTSNLDPQAEAAIFAELKQQLHGRMAVVISHRFSTVRVADRIYVIDAGRVLEAGTHGELIARKGRYAELFELQASGYR